MTLPAVRIGLGHDTHRLGPDRPLMLGGVEIPFDRGLVGHSDADVLLHALTDALLGALALGDIGEWFPNSDEKWKDAGSDVFVTEAVAAVVQRNWNVANVDCTVFAERPKLSPFKHQIRESIAGLTGIAVDAVSIKAKTGEKVGPVGRGESISADAIVLLHQ